MTNQVAGYSLFNEVEDKEVQTYNRARVMKNMMQDNSDKEKNVSQKGQAMLIMYMAALPETERGEVHGKLVELLKAKDTTGV